MCCRARVHGCVQTAGTKPRLRQTVSTPGGQRASCLAGACGARRLLWSDKIAKQGIKHRLACLDRRTSQHFVDSSTVALSCPVSPHLLCVSCVVLETRLHCLPPSAPTQPQQPERLDSRTCTTRTTLRCSLQPAKLHPRTNPPQPVCAPSSTEIDTTCYDLSRPPVPIFNHDARCTFSLHAIPQHRSPAKTFSLPGLSQSWQTPAKQRFHAPDAIAALFLKQPSTAPRGCESVVR